MMASFRWVCPFCNMTQTVSSNFSANSVGLSNDGSKWGPVGCMIVGVSCSNEDCRELQLIISLHKAHYNHAYSRYDATDEELFEIARHPSSGRTPQPAYIPSPIVQDYYEACDILLLSPKASATLSRRCLQGMIRDFCGISKNRLIDEIKELRARVDGGAAPAGVQADIVDAIDAVRQIGNIGAHMERDINVIVDVDPDEAKTLLQLLELLFKEWYVARETRRRRIESIGAIAAAKEAQKKLPPPAT